MSDIVERLRKNQCPGRGGGCGSMTMCICDDAPVSLKPLTVEDALKALLQTKPEPKRVAKSGAKKKRTDGA